MTCVSEVLATTVALCPPLRSFPHLGGLSLSPSNFERCVFHKGPFANDVETRTPCAQAHATSPPCELRCHMRLVFPMLRKMKLDIFSSRSDHHRRHRPLPGSPRLNKTSCDGNASDADGHCGAHAARKRKERTISESDKHETKLCRQGSVKNRCDTCRSNMISSTPCPQIHATSLT